MSELINTLEAPGEFDALTSLRPGEPYILFIGRDELAPPLVQQWAELNRKRALDEFEAGQIDEEKRDRELRKSTQAEQIGWSMVEYKAGYQAEAPREASRPTYSGYQVDDVTARKDAIQSARVRAASALNNAEFEAVEALNLMADDPEFAELVTQIRETLTHTCNLSRALKPQRPVIGQ